MRGGRRGLSTLRAHSPRFEEEQHFRVLVKMAAQELANGVPDSGHLYASIRAGRSLTPAGDLQETFSGMEQVPGRGDTGRSSWVTRVSQGGWHAPRVTTFHGK